MNTKINVIAKFGYLSLVAALVVACVSTVKPYEESAEIVPQTEADYRLWHASRQFDAALAKSGNLIGNDDADAYVQSVLDGLFPEREDVFRVHILKSADLNAMALPNGSIYINAGLLAAMANEAQLATVLAHEGIHVLQKHSAEGRQRVKQAAGWSMVFALAGIPPGLFDMGLYSAIAGHSRANEQESDNLGYERLVAANYDVREASKVFEQMLIEVDASAIKQPYFFASHPKLQDRITNFDNLTIFEDKSKPMRLGAEDFHAALGEIRALAIREKLAAGRYAALIALLEQDDYRASYSAEGYFILAEAYRLRAVEGDNALAKTAYEQAMAGGYLAPDAYKGAGILAYKDKRYDEAESFFEEYLANADQADSERGFVEFYLNKIQESE